MEVITKKTDGSIPLAGNAGTPAKVVSTVDNKSLCSRCRRKESVFDGGPDHPDTGMAFTCGIKVENDQVGSVVTTCGYFAPVSPIIDAGRCCSCEAHRICQVIVPHGSWNPYGGVGVKPCPGLLK